MIDPDPGQETSKETNRERDLVIRKMKIIQG